LLNSHEISLTAHNENWAYLSVQIETTCSHSGSAVSNKRFATFGETTAQFLKESRRLFEMLESCKYA